MQRLVGFHAILILIPAIYFIVGCSRVDKAVISTDIVSELDISTVTCGGNITSDGGSEISSRGVCWSESENPNISESKTSDGIGMGPFTSHLTGLKPGTKYYVRAYATNSAGTSYGNCESFTTFSIKDIDGNGYNTVTIGTQVWMTTNLKVTHYNNGDNLINVTSDDEWSTLTESAYCCYKNNLSNSLVYGKLYNFYAAADSRNVCPDGWHVPSIEDWITLFRFLGNEFTADVKMREAGTAHWIQDTGADNSSGFTFLPAGNRESDGRFFNQTYMGSIWSSTAFNEYNSVAGWLIVMEWNRSKVRGIPYGLSYGASIRCLKN